MPPSSRTFKSHSNRPVLFRKETETDLEGTATWVW